jgi:hypothetical protein
MPDPHLVTHYRFVDLDSVLKYDTVKSWFSSRIGDGRKTAIYHFCGVPQVARIEGAPQRPGRMDLGVPRDSLHALGRLEGALLDEES